MESDDLPSSGSASSSAESWTERSRRDVFLDALGGVRPGSQRPTIRENAQSLAFIVVLAFLLPSAAALVDRVGGITSVLPILLIAMFGIGEAVFDQHRLGRPLSRALTAGFGSAAKWLIMVCAFVVCSLVIGQPAEGSRLYAAIDAVIPDISPEIAILLLSILAVAIIVVLVRRAARGFPEDEHNAAIRTAIRAERATRAAATGREAAPTMG